MIGFVQNVLVQNVSVFKTPPASTPTVSPSACSRKDIQQKIESCTRICLGLPKLNVITKYYIFLLVFLQQKLRAYIKPKPGLQLDALHNKPLLWSVKYMQAHIPAVFLLLILLQLCWKTKLLPLW